MDWAKIASIKIAHLMQEHTALHAQKIADKMVNERMPTEGDAIRYAADYATELDASEEPHTDIEKMDYFLQGERWFRSRMKGENG